MKLHLASSGRMLVIEAKIRNNIDLLVSSVMEKSLCLGKVETLPISKMAIIKKQCVVSFREN